MAAQKKQSRQVSSFPVKALKASQDSDFRKKFVCPEESMRYAGALEQIVFNRLRDRSSHASLIEFGSGTGSPVIAALLNSDFFGTVYGYEVNPVAAETARNSIGEHGLNRQYIIRNESFFEASDVPVADWLIANPPYIPCENAKLLTLPDLCGGAEGNAVSKRLLSFRYRNVMLEISSYSNPVALVTYALSLGYQLVDFTITHIPFGEYSRQDIVQKKIREMKKAGKAFFTENCYLVGSAFFTKTVGEEPDLSSEFLTCLTAFKGSEKS